MSNPNDDLTIRDPIHGMMTFPGNSVVRKLIDTKEFQRLRRIKQLGFSDFVYPGATHTRFSHSLGVAWLVQKAVRQLFDNEQIVEDDFPGYSEKQVIDAMACAGLLHDIGHGPFSHTFEKIIKEKFNNLKHEEIAGMIITGNTDVNNILIESIEENLLPKFADNDIYRLIVGDNSEDSKLKPKKGETSRLQILASLIGSQLDCDRLDFLLRDTYFCGTHIHVDIDYIFRSMLVKDLFGVGRRIVFEKKAVSVIVQFLLSRIFHYNNVAYHKTTRGVEVLYRRVFDTLKFKDLFKESGEYRKLEKPELNLKCYCELTDSTIIGKLERKLKSKRTSNNTKIYIENFFNRTLFKMIDQQFVDDVNGEPTWNNKADKYLKEKKQTIYRDTPEDKQLYIFNEKAYSTLRALQKMGICLKDEYEPGMQDKKYNEYVKFVKEIDNCILIFDKDVEELDGLADISEYSEVVRNLKGIEQQNRFYSTKEARNQLRSITKGVKNGEENA